VNIQSINTAPELRGIENINVKDLELRISRLNQTLSYSEEQQLEMRDHKFSSEVIFKDILRIAVSTILGFLMASQGIQASTLEEMLLVLSQDKSRIAKQIFAKLFYILDNWGNLINSPVNCIEHSLVQEVLFKLRDIFQQNFATFLGENLAFSHEIIKEAELSHHQSIQLKELVEQNGLRQIMFSRSYDLATMEYLLATSVRCFQNTLGEREAVELSNEIAKFLLRWLQNMSIQDRETVIKKLRELVGNDKSLNATIDFFSNFDLKIGDALIEISPPLYSTQKRLMLRVLKASPSGFDVNIYHIPYNPNEVVATQHQLLNSFKGTRLQTYSSPVIPQNEALSSLINIPNSVEFDIAKLFSMLEQYKDVIPVNDSLVEGRINNLVYSKGSTAYIDSMITSAISAYDHPLKLSGSSKMYDDLVDAVFIGSDDTSVTALTDEQKMRVSANTFKLVTSGSDFQTAVRVATQNETTEKVEYKISSSGPCVVYKQEVMVQAPSETKSNSEATLTPQKIGDSSHSIMKKGAIAVRTVTTKIDGNKFRTIMVCPVCEKGKFELKAECDTPKDYSCPECNNNVLEMRSWWETSDKDGKAFEQKINGARRELSNRRNTFEQNKQIHDSPEMHPNWADSVIEFLSFGLLKA
jgi:hypothetical protein